jgi:hypothetical protein
VVELLLADSRVDPAAQDNQATVYAGIQDCGKVLQLLLADSRVDPGAQDNQALSIAAKRNNIELAELLLEHPAVVVTRKVILAGDEEYSYDVVDLLMAEQPQVILQPFEVKIECVHRGPLDGILRKKEGLAALTLLLATQRTRSSQVVGRVADVLRQICEEFLSFRTVDYEINYDFDAANSE